MRLHQARFVAKFCGVAQVESEMRPPLMLRLKFVLLRR